jgi:putative transposase
MNQENTFQKLQYSSYYHIYNRGNNKEIIFKEAENYFYFLNLWKKYIEPVAETFCFNLLPNHFHFFIRIREKIIVTLSENSNDLKEKSLEQSFSNLFNAYAKAINKKYNRTGSLFQERFRRKEILNDLIYINHWIYNNKCS